MIIITGASGFIGSALVNALNHLGIGKEVVVVDDFYKHYKEINLKGNQVRDWVHRDIFLGFLPKIGHNVEFVFHLGARTDTFEQDKSIFQKLNIDYSKALWEFCAQNDIPFYYASSAATYGDGALGFVDDEANLEALKPLNEYGRSKHVFDLWVLKQKQAPSHWAGFKFFNIYGPNEYHKKAMASVIFHAYHQIRKTTKLKLFKSYKPEFDHGEQMRDFVYIKDLINFLISLMENPIKQGIYNFGTGKARTFNDLGKGVFKSMGVTSDIEYIEMPKKIKDRYQYWTQADMTKLLAERPKLKFHSLEEGIEDYVGDYLSKRRYYYNLP